MGTLAIILGGMIGLLGIAVVFAPRTVVALVDHHYEPVLYLATGFRAFAGVVLILAAADSLFPTTFRILGVISLVAAAVLIALPTERWRALINWWIGLPTIVFRSGGLIAIALGGFIIYGFN